MKFWGMVFLVATSMMAVLKHEQEEDIVFLKFLSKVS
jgi:hypothetical protein